MTPTDPSKHARLAFGLTFGTMAVGALGALVITIIGLLTREPRQPPPPPAAVVTATVQTEPGVTEPTEGSVSGEEDEAPATAKPGPVRVSVLPFKDLSGSDEFAYLREGLAEVVVTDFGGVRGVQLIERGPIDVDIAESELSQTKYVAPATRAALGKIAGAEVAVLGSYQRAGGQLRANARFIEVETGEILAAVMVEQPEAAVFELQDALAKRVRDTVREVRERMRP